MTTRWNSASQQNHAPFGLHHPVTFLIWENGQHSYVLDGKTLALSYQPELIGTYRSNAKDLIGVSINQQATDAARFGK